MSTSRFARPPIGPRPSARRPSPQSRSRSGLPPWSGRDCPSANSARVPVMDWKVSTFHPTVRVQRIFSKLEFPDIMKETIQLLFLFSASLYFYSCSDNETKSKEPTEHLKPEFADNGRTIDSLKNVYNCDVKEYIKNGIKRIIYL